MAGGPETKKARWSPNSFTNSPVTTGTRDLFANYGYGSQAAINQTPQQQPGYGAVGLGNGNGQLYSTPSLTVNTATGLNGSGLASQMSPSSATSPFSGMQSQNNGFGAYGMNGMNGMNGMLGMGMGMSMLGGFPYSPQMGTFQQVRLLSGSFLSYYLTHPQNFGQQRMGGLNVPMTPTSGYSPVALNAALGSAGNATGRTVYVGNLPSTASVDELLNLVHFGPLESIRVLPEKSCVFLSFLDGATAAAFHADATVKKLSLHGQELKIGWGKPSPVPSQVALAIQQSNASRNVYIGGLDENMTEEQLRDDLSRFGLIDQVKIVRDKNIGFVHFLSISTATKVTISLYPLIRS